MKTSSPGLDERMNIYVAGHRGMVGAAICNHLKEKGYKNIVTRSHKELDLIDQRAVGNFFQKQPVDLVVLAAAKVGGIFANNQYPAEFIYQNLMIEANVIHQAYAAGIKRLLFMGSSCIYPRKAPQPMKEEYLLSGKLEPTNEPYAVAKIAGIKLCAAYNRQYNTRYYAVMPTNLYGTNDNFDLLNSHVLPAMIRKFHLAKLASSGDWNAIINDQGKYGMIPDDFLACLVSISRTCGYLPLTPGNEKIDAADSGDSVEPSVILWGSGKPRREFLHVDDLAEASFFVMNLNDDAVDSLFVDRSLPILNIGCGEDLALDEVAAMVAEEVGYTGDIVWDKSKPDGVPRKLLDVSKLKNLGWKPKKLLKAGIRKTYEWYLNLC